ncbi:hypothetical protein [Massilia sp. CCM 8734]|uniref:hypothetical protein n=1 Tax=Massilia sp. CCM 8734 TaxID=2609283 RepID=UPI00141E3EFA|nr:hypothetical protein [Massilia sp. CCM 8734]NHZ94622.1 hypothetical protein [Massilia sp. CCM 8734]
MIARLIRAARVRYLTRKIERLHSAITDIQMERVYLHELESQTFRRQLRLAERRRAIERAA